MNVAKFNEEATKLINDSEGKIGFVTEEVMDKNAGLMRLCADNLIKCLQESFDITVKENISAIDNETFGLYLLDMTKLYFLHLATKKPVTPAEAEVAAIAIMTGMSVDDMRNELAKNDVIKSGIHDESIAASIRLSYDAHSEGIIKDAFKTMSINNILKGN